MGSKLSYNDTEAGFRKQAQVFNEFMYDNTNDIIIDTIEEIKKIIDSLDNECEDLNVYFSRLSNTYGSVSKYDGTISSMKRDIMNSMNDLNNRYKKLMNDFSLALIELMSKDNRLLDDLQKISTTLYRR